MSAFFSFLSTFTFCYTVFAIASVVALSMPKSALRTVLNEVLSFVAVALCIFYIVSPVDCFPEGAIGPVGLLDDAGALWLAYYKFKDAMKLRKQRRESEGLTDNSTAKPEVQ